MNLEIVIVCHKGKLEIETLFLVYSIKKYLKGNYIINIAIPTNLDKPDSSTLMLLHQWGCNFFYFDNEFLLGLRKACISGDYVSNKLYAVKSIKTNDPVLFLDSDTCFLQKTETKTSFKNAFSIKQANRANVTKWDSVYALFDLPFPQKTIQTSIDKKQLPPYFNAGVILFPADIRTDLVDKWIYYFLKVSESEILKKELFMPFNRDQVALSLAIEDLGIPIEILEEKYNFPIGSKHMEKLELPNIVHYHRPQNIVLNYTLRNLFFEFKNKIDIATQLEKENKHWNIIINNSVAIVFIRARFWLSKKFHLFMNKSQFKTRKSSSSKQ